MDKLREAKVQAIMSMINIEADEFETWKAEGELRADEMRLAYQYDDDVRQ